MRPPATPATSGPVVGDGTQRLASAPEARTAWWARRDNIDHRDIDDSTDPALRKLPIENTEPNEPTLATLAHDPTLPTDNTDPREAMDRTLSLDHRDNVDPPDGMLMHSPCSGSSQRRKDRPKGRRAVQDA